MRHNRFSILNFAPNNHHLEYSDYGKGHSRSHLLPPERGNKGLLLLKHYGSLFGAYCRGHRCPQIISSPLWSQRRRLHHYKEGNYQAVGSYREQQKEDGATRRSSIYKWNWTYMITPAVSSLKTEVYVVILVV